MTDNENGDFGVSEVVEKTNRTDKEIAELKKENENIVLLKGDRFVDKDGVPINEIGDEEIIDSNLALQKSLKSAQIKELTVDTKAMTATEITLQSPANNEMIENTKRLYFEEWVKSFDKNTNGSEPLVIKPDGIDLIAHLNQDQLLSLYIAAYKRKKIIEDEAKELASQLDELDDIIQQKWLDSGITSQTKNGKTVFFIRKIWARVHREDFENGEEYDEVVRQRAIDALRLAGLSQFVRETFNINSLSAHFREKIKDSTEKFELPEQLKGKIDVEEVIKLGTRTKK